MSHASLADFVDEMQRSGLLARVESPVSCADGQLAEVARQLSGWDASYGWQDADTRGRSGAILFQQPGESRVPVLTNILGCEAALRIACGGRSIADVVGRLRGALEEEHSAGGWLARLRGSSTAASRYRPRTVKSGPCQQVVKLGGDVDLDELPLVRQWPAEGQPSITAAAVVTRCPESGETAVGRYDLQRVGPRQLAIAWQPQDAAFQHFAAAQQSGKPLSAAVVLGGHPLFSLALDCPLPGSIDPLHWTGFLCDKALDMATCRTSDLQVPAEAELVIEGEFDPTEQAAPGPSADDEGFLRQRGTSPLLNIAAVTQRANPIWPLLLRHRAPSETAFRMQTVMKLMLPLYQQLTPELIDWSLPAVGGGRRLAIVAVRKRYPHHARALAAALGSIPPLRCARMLVLVDEEVDVHQPSDLLYQITAQAHPSQDWITDTSALEPCVLIDATTKLPGESQHVQHPLTAPEELQAQALELLQQESLQATAAK